MEKLRFLEQQYINLSLTIFLQGVLSVIDALFKIKIPQKLTKNKTTIIKTGIFSAIAACWSVILLGTFLTLK